MKILAYPLLDSDKQMTVCISTGRERNVGLAFSKEKEKDVSKLVVS